MWILEQRKCKETEVKIGGVEETASQRRHPLLKKKRGDDV